MDHRVLQTFVVPLVRLWTKGRLSRSRQDRLDQHRLKPLELRVVSIYRLTRAAGQLTRAQPNSRHVLGLHVAEGTLAVSCGRRMLTVTMSPRSIFNERSFCQFTHLRGKNGLKATVKCTKHCSPTHTDTHKQHTIIKIFLGLFCQKYQTGKTNKKFLSQFWKQQQKYPREVHFPCEYRMSPELTL